MAENIQIYHKSDTFRHGIVHFGLLHFHLSFDFPRALIFSSSLRFL